MRSVSEPCLRSDIVLHRPPDTTPNRDNGVLRFASTYSYQQVVDAVLFVYYMVSML